ncbi:hypothetical protein Gohar_027813, partial [Gossypium harknessii]|nr:hypothetical protein [Gossypium harknessii]
GCKATRFEGKQLKIADIFLFKLRTLLEFGLQKKIRGCAVRKGLSWPPPPHVCYKFNVDESARGKPGPGGCGGVLRNSSGDILALGIIDSNVAKVLAIKVALDFLVRTVDVF